MRIPVILGGSYQEWYKQVSMLFRSVVDRSCCMEMNLCCGLTGSHSHVYIHTALALCARAQFPAEIPVDVIQRKLQETLTMLTREQPVVRDFSAYFSL